MNYWRSVALVFSGTALAQAIPLLGSLVIARIFAPAEFGIYTAWLGITYIVGMFVTGRFEMALALEPDGLPRAQAATATVLTTVMVVGALFVLGLPAYLLLEDQLPAFPVTLAVLLIPASLIFAGSQIWQAWTAAEGRFKALSAQRIVQAAAVTVLQMAIGLAAPSAGALALAYMIGLAIGLAVIMRDLPLARLDGGLGSLKSFWSRYRRFPIYSLPADTVNTAAAQLPLAIIASRFGADSAGFVALAFRTLGAPISLMGTAVLDVFKRRASTAWRDRGDCRSEYRQTFVVLAAGSLLATIAFFFSGEGLFAFAFGEKWRPAGEAAVILLPLFALRFVASPLSYVFYVAEKQHVDLLWQLCLLATTMSALLLPSGYRETLLSYAVGYGFLYVVYIALSYRFSGGAAPAQRS